MEKRLLVAILCLTNLCVGYAFLSPLRTRPVWDLPSLYFAGRLVLAGQVSQLYNRAAYVRLREEVRQAKPPAFAHALYYNRPAWEALLFVPLAVFCVTIALNVARV